MTIKKLSLSTAVAFFAGWAIVQAAPLVMEDFSTDPENWFAEDEATGGAPGGVLDWTGDQGGYLRYDVQAGPASDLIFTTGAAFLGDWTATSTSEMGLDISFDFYADTTESLNAYPAGMQLYFDDGVGNTWYYNLIDEAQAMIVDDSWYNFRTSVLFDSQGDWWSTTGTDWSSSFTSVTEVGLWLTTDDVGENQVFGLDNFGLLLPIPEPGAMMLLGSALLSLSLTFRKKIGVRARELLNS